MERLPAKLPARVSAAAGAGLAVTFARLSVQAFAVFPSAVLLGAPAGPTCVISIAAYQAAFEQYDHSLGSAIALIMGGVELVASHVLGARSFFYRARRRWHERLTMIRDQGLTSRIRRFAIWALATLFVLNLLAVIAAVVVNSFGTRWLGTWLPAGWTTGRYFSAWKEFQLSSVVLVTFEIVFTVVIISGILGVMTAYALARRDFAGKRVVILLFLLPLLIPLLTYGILLATVLYQLGLGGTFWGVVLINVVLSLPFVVLVMIPFIEQIGPAHRGRRPCSWRRHHQPVPAHPAAAALAGNAGSAVFMLVRT